MVATSSTVESKRDATERRPTPQHLNRLLILAGVLIVAGLGVLTGQGLARPSGAWANGWIEDDASGFCLWLFGLWCGATLAHKHIVKPMREHHEEVIALHKAHHAELLERIDRKAK